MSVREHGELIAKGKRDTREGEGANEREIYQKENEERKKRGCKQAKTCRRVFQFIVLYERVKVRTERSSTLASILPHYVSVAHWLPFWLLVALAMQECNAPLPTSILGNVMRADE